VKAFYRHGLRWLGWSFGPRHTVSAGIAAHRGQCPGSTERWQPRRASNDEQVDRVERSVLVRMTHPKVVCPIRMRGEVANGVRAVTGGGTERRVGGGRLKSGARQGHVQRGEGSREVVIVMVQMDGRTRAHGGSRPGCRRPGLGNNGC
jgi:hypothetical protein